MKVLERKERSTELNTTKAMLIAFKSLVEEEGFIIYKSNDIIYYIYDPNGAYIVIKKSDFLHIEKYLDNNEYIEINYKDLRYVVGLKKSEITNISYDTEKFDYEITKKGEEVDHYIIKKNTDSRNIMEDIISKTSETKISENFDEATYDGKLQKLVSKTNGSTYPYKITFSNDLNFKLKLEKDSKYYYRTLNDGTFLQVITKSDYDKIYQAQSVLFTFNYLNKREV